MQRLFCLSSNESSYLALLISVESRRLIFRLALFGLAVFGLTLFGLAVFRSAINKQTIIAAAIPATAYTALRSPGRNSTKEVRNWPRNTAIVKYDKLRPRYWGWLCSTTIWFKRGIEKPNPRPQKTAPSINNCTVSALKKVKWVKANMHIASWAYIWHTKVNVAEFIWL